MSAKGTRAGTEVERALWRVSAGWPVAERLHLLLRYRTAPWERLLSRLPREGTFLDVGCGSGLLAWLLSRDSFTGSYLGIDPDSRKIARAGRWRLPGETYRFDGAASSAAPRGAFDAAALVDVLYLVPPSSRAEFLASIGGALVPGGRIFVLTSGGGPAWKRTLDRLQERAAVSLGVTRGDAVAPCDGDEAARLLGAAGFEGAAAEDVGDGYVHGFELATGTWRG